MRTYHTEIIIAAPIHKVWESLLKVDDYPNWNPLVHRIEGDLSKDGKIRTTIIPLRQTFAAKITALIPPHQLVWEGHLISSFLLKGQHRYRLIEMENSQTKLEHGESFTGVLSYLIPAALLKRMETAFEEHNAALKQLVEHE